MKKHFFIVMLTLLYFSSIEITISQNKYGENPEECKKNLIAFYNFAKARDYENAFESWQWSFKNCPAASKNIYKYGLKITEERYEKAIDDDQKEEESQLIDKIYGQRIMYFPDNLGKVYSDWATSLEKRGATKDTIFEKLNLAFKQGPFGLSLKNTVIYFQEILDREISFQKKINAYDDLSESIKLRVHKLSKQLDSINELEASGRKLTKKEYLIKRNNTILLRGSGQIQSMLNISLNEFVTSFDCDRLIPLYEKHFEANKNNAKWLRRTTARFLDKECTDNDLYKRLLEAYIKVDNSNEALICYYTINDNGNDIPFINRLKKMIDAEKDPYKKAEYYYKIASTLKNRNKSQSRNYAYRALKVRPSMGKAYLLIAQLYAMSANSCGVDEFSKRMVFYTAADKAKKAKEVDPSITYKANKYIKNYMAVAPQKKFLNRASGKEFKIGCWIGETIIIP